MKIGKSTLLLLLLLISGLIYGQKSFRLSFQLDGLTNQKCRLVFYYGDQQIVQDSGMTDAAGKIVFIKNDHDEPGMYRLQKDKNKGFDFVFNNEDVSIVTDKNMDIGNIVVKDSKENQIFFDYYRHKFDIKARIDVLDQFLKYYPPADTFYYRAAAYAGILSSSYKHYLDSLLKDFPNMMVTRIIRLDQLPDIRPGELDQVTANQYRSHYFDSVDLKDSLILNTPYLPVKVVSYLSLYINPGASRQNQEKNFMQAVDSLMKFTEGGPRVREMIVNYLISGFQTYGFEQAMTYLVENYVLGQKCVSDQQEDKLRIRVEGFKKLAIGSAAPLFEVSDSDGNLLRLADNGGKNTLLIFWSGNCPHCEAIIPELKILYDHYKDKVRFIGVSVDQDENVWRAALKKNDLRWINVAELKGWDGKIIQDYYVYATPTFLLLDPGLRIIAKPTGMAELKGALLN